MYTQAISVNVRIAGEQDVRIDTHGGGGPGSHISVASGGIIVYCYDTAAVRTYCEAWLSSMDLAARLPEDTNPGKIGVPGPGVIVRATGRDDFKQVLTSDELRIRIGRVVWIVMDRAAHLDMAEAWRSVREISSLTFVRRTTNGARRAVPKDADQ